MKRVLFLLTCIFMGIGMATAQVLKVTGKVYSEADGEPVIGASVLVAGTSLGASTDIEGNFTIENVPASATTLRVSYVGMTTQEVHIVRGKAMKIIMVEDSKVLDDVVVTAFGTLKKSQFTGSAAVVKSEEIGKTQATNAINALNGKMAGVQMTNASGQPGSESPAIRIRGISSINAGNAPLIILDGAPYDGDLNSINPQDIESMTVNKDAASNALYGARGANGVIFITTKSASNKGDAIVTFDAKYGINERATEDYEYIKDPAKYYELYFKGLKDYYTNNLGYDERKAYTSANTNIFNDVVGLGYNVYTIPTGEYFIGRDGKINPNATLGRLVNGHWVTPDDWMDAAYEKGTRQEYNVNISGANDRSSYYASLGYLDNEGITANSSYERISARLKADYKVKSWLKTGANISYTRYKAERISEDGASNSSGNIFAFATQIAPIYPLYVRDEKGNIMKDDNNFTIYDFGEGDNAGFARPFLSGGNPYAANRLDKNYYEGNSFNVSGFAEATFLKNFKFNWTTSLFVDESRSTSTTNPYYGSYAESNGMVNKGHGRTVAQNHTQILTWEKDFGKHNINAMVGHEYNRRKAYSLSAGRKGQFDPTNDELASAIIENGSDSYRSDYNNEGYIGRAIYDYASGKYVLMASFRREASSRFHKDNRWGNFWSASAAWDISKEKFFKAEWVNMLKVKASYGEQGNDQIGNYLYTNTYSIVNSNGYPATVPSTLGNKDITWEKQQNFNAGIDFQLWNRINGTIEYFNRKTSDMLLSFPLPPSYGFTSYYANVGDMVNKGVEVQLNATLIRAKDFEWNVNGNITMYENEISYLPNERKTMVVDGKGGYSSGMLFYGEGCEMFTFHLKKFAGVNENGESMWFKNVEKQKVDKKGQPVFKTENGKKVPVMTTVREKTTSYSEASYYLCESSQPDAYGGFGTSLAWKGFDFSIDFAFQLGGQVYDSDYQSLMSNPTSDSRGTNIHVDMLNAWTKENKTDIPRFQFDDTYAASSSDRFLIDASYLSINSINFGYTLPKLLTKKVGIDKCRFYVSADNVCVWSKRQGLDPRQSFSGSATNSYYAPIRTISGGVTLTF